MISRKTIRALVAVSGAAALLLGVVWAASATPSQDGVTTSAKRHQTVRVSAFKKKFTPTRAQRAQRRGIRRQVKRSPRTSIASTAMISRSRPAPISGWAASAWIAPAADGSVCTFIPDPLDGWGASCATASEVAAGSAMTLLGGAPSGPLANAAIVAVVVPDGGQSPIVEQPNGSVVALDVSSNVAAAVVSPGALVRSGRAAITVPDPQLPEGLSP